jgi:hypothetical protein
MDKDIIYYVIGTKGKTTAPFFQSKGSYTREEHSQFLKLSDLQKCKNIVLITPRAICDVS